MRIKTELLIISAVFNVELDEIDYKILDILTGDTRTPFTEVGRDLGISDATSQIRVNR